MRAVSLGLLLVVLASQRSAADTQIAADPPTLRPVKTCVLPFGEVEPTRARFAGLFAPVRQLDDIRELGSCQLVVIASGWFEAKDTFHAVRPHLEAWVARGGALLVFQPNPIGEPEESVTIELFDTWFHVYNWYDKRDEAVVDRERPHPIVANLARSDLTFPADQITRFDRKRWTAVVRGSVTQSASLIVGVFGKGRVAVDTDNPARSRGVTETSASHTDAFLRSLVSWLVRR